MNFAPRKISNCLVCKLSQTDDYLIAYIISDDCELNTEAIRTHCGKYLCQYMVPVCIMVLDQFPLSPNGKVDRQNLPLPSLLSINSFNSNRINSERLSKSERKVHDLWCMILRLETIPRHKNCFALGGSSLSLMKLFNYYQYHLAPDKQLNILDFFTDPTIVGHVQLLINSKSKAATVWHPLHLTQGLFIVETNHDLPND